MKLSVLSSGSSGNCYILENDKEALIIEAGVPLKEVKIALGFNVSKIVGVVVSHSHGDHAKYISEYEKAGIKVCKPYEEMDWAYNHQYGNFKVKPFDLIHDVPCFGFHITHPDIGKLVYASDTEYIKYRFLNINHILVEANYSEELIEHGANNQEHILNGHMSLKTALKFISTNDNPALRNVVLIHLSDKNADSAIFLQKTKETVKYGADCHIAKKGLEVDLKLVPFI